MTVKLYESRKLMGTAAAAAVARTIHLLLISQPMVNIIFAAAPSQNEFLEALQEQTVDWTRINVFHMDEYLDLDKGSRQSFGYYLQTHLLDNVHPHAIYYLNGNAVDIATECRRYTTLLQKYPADIVCMGIGENNHLAFNDPAVADFNDPSTVKLVFLDEECRQQQVHDGCFPTLADVPTTALTLTIPALCRGRYIFTVVPGDRKALAVFHTLNSPLSEEYPSTILKKHPAVQLFLDKDSSRLIHI